MTKRTAKTHLVTHLTEPATEEAREVWQILKKYSLKGRCDVLSEVLAFDKDLGQLVRCVMNAEAKMAVVQTVLGMSRTTPDKVFTSDDVYAAFGYAMSKECADVLCAMYPDVYNRDELLY